MADLDNKNNPHLIYSLFHNILYHTENEFTSLKNFLTININFAVVL